MIVGLKHSKFLHLGPMMQQINLKKRLMGSVTGNKCFFLFPCISILLLIVVGKLLETWLSVC